MSSPPKSPTMEAAADRPHSKPSVTPSEQQLASSASYNSKSPNKQPRPSQRLPSLPAAAGGGGDQLSDEEEETNSFNNNLKKGQDEYFDSFPPGYRFNPHDEELVVHYLKKKVLDQPLPPNRIMEVNLYRHNPEVLAGKHAKYGEKEWYFFTPRDRKYPNGNRPKRAAGDGYWKATGADKAVKSQGNEIVGYRKALVFYRGKPPKGVKTNWIMHEFRVKDSPVRRKRGEKDMRLDNWVLCRIYQKTSDKINKRSESRNHAEYSAGEMNSPSSQQNMEVDMSTIVDPVPEYDCKYSSKVYDMPNVCGVLPNSMVHGYGNMGQQQPMGGNRVPSMPLIPESLIGPRYIDESTILQEDMLFDMKGLGSYLYGTTNYPMQFSSFDQWP